MKQFRLKIFLFCSIAVFSCSKDQVTFNNVDRDLATAKKLVQTSVNRDITITYNPDGKPQEIIFDHSPYIYTKTYSYQPGQVLYTLKLSNKVDESGILTISNGKVTGYARTAYDASENPFGTYNESFEYNIRGLLSKHSFSSGAYKTFKYDQQDNLVEQLYYNDLGQAESKTVYAYTNIVDKFPWFGEHSAWGMGFFLPPMSVHLPASHTSTNLLTNSVNWSYKYSYDLDSEGYVLKASKQSLLPSATGYDWTNVFAK